MEFIDNGNKFIDTLALYDEEEQDIIISLLINYENYNKIDEHIDLTLIADESLKIVNKLDYRIANITLQIKEISDIDISSYGNKRKFDDRVLRAVIGSEFDFLYDEEFSNILVEFLRANPNQFSNTIGNYSNIKQGQIETVIAKYINLEKTPLQFEDNMFTEKTNDLIDNIKRKMIDPFIKDYRYNNDLKNRTEGALMVDKITLLDNDISLGETFEFIINLVSNDKEYIEIYIYANNNGRRYLKGRIPVKLNGNVSDSILLQSKVFNVGDYTFDVEIYDSDTKQLIASESSIIAFSSYGEWYIDIDLYPHNGGYRQYLGEMLYLHRPDGLDILSTSEVLGKSVSGDDPSVYRGNTPTGVYRGHLSGPQSNTYSYGPYKVIAMEGVSGDIVDDGTRSGIWIHGGDPSTNIYLTHYPLRSTYGCVRISNSTQLAIQELIEEQISLGAGVYGNINILEVPY